ncbi:MAG: regulator of sigma protease [Blastocatellia bacterium]|jgi:membrane-associated protease RseP (regulator of RpoE activity)|nr:regulator of sigma protease [Blastocatellia bacterium]
MISGFIISHQLLAGLPAILSIVCCTALAMILHELGHLAAARACKVSASEIGLGLGPRLFGFRVAGITFSLRAIPIASFLRIDGTALETRSVPQQLFVHLAGIIFNLVAAFLTYGTVFGWVNLVLAAGNLLPLYKHDGWKCGVVVMRALLRKKSQPVEWTLTFSGGFASLAIISSLIQVLK